MASLTLAVFEIVPVAMAGAPRPEATKFPLEDVIVRLPPDPLALMPKS